MRSDFPALAAVVLALVCGVAHAAADPAAVLNAYRAASGGDAWNGKAVVKIESKLTGQGLTGTDTSMTDLRTGNSVERYTLGPASGAQGFDGSDAWEQGPNGEVNLQKGGDGLQLALNTAYQNANLWWRADFGGAKVNVLANESCGVSTCAVLEITPKGGLPFQAWFNRHPICSIAPCFMSARARPPCCFPTTAASMGCVFRSGSWWTTATASNTCKPWP